MKWFLLAALVLPGSVIALEAVARWRRQRPDPKLSISKPRYLYLNADEALEQRTRKRREDAAAIRREAARKETGTVHLPMDTLRAFGRRPRS